MIELDLAWPAANQRMGVKIFYATDAEHSLWRRARRSRLINYAQASSTGGEAAALSLVGRGDTWR